MTPTMLDGISTNISKLIALYEAEKQRADSLQAKLSSREEDIRKYKEQITGLNLQIDNLSLMNAFRTSTSDDNSAAKDAVSKLIREVDKCIKLLEC